MTRKLFAQIIAVAAVMTVLVILIFYSPPIEAAPVERSEVDRAMAFLLESLREPRNTYVDFLNARQHLRGQTPEFSYVIDLDTVISRREYAIAHITVPAEGLYYFTLTYELPDNAFNQMSISVWINGERPFDEAANIILPAFWEDETKDFPVNRFGDQIPPRRRLVAGIHTVGVIDAGFSSDRPLLFHLNEGENTIAFRNDSSWELWLGDVSIYSERILPTHAPTRTEPYSGLIVVHAIEYIRNNSTFVQMYGHRNAAIEPFHPVDRQINMISFSRLGNEVFFTMDIPHDDYYAITLHSRTRHDDFSTFVTVRINGEIPFEEAASFPLTPFGDERWRNQTLRDENGDPLMFFLTEGTHEISIRLDLAPLSLQIRQLRLLIDHINQLGLDIRRVTGREIDRNRTWRLTRYIPELDYYLEAYEIIFRDMINELAVHSPRNANSSAANSMVSALMLLDRLRERPDELPLHLTLLNGARSRDSSVLQMAGVALDSLLDTGMHINRIYIGRTYDLPREHAAFHQTLRANAAHLWATYTSDKFLVRNRADSLNVWANHSMLHIDILQRLADTRFTPETGIQVNISVMPDQNRLILSKAAGTNPDIAIGVSASTPFELGSRGALHDLTQFEDFWCFMDNIVPGALVPYIFNDQVFALPETVNFGATVYRTDILPPLGLAAPDTWADVASMQSVLQRFDMTFFKPIAGTTGMKNFAMTTPLIYQFGGQLYNPDGLTTAINQPEGVRALTFLGDLFTLSAVSEQVPNFFNAFRFGQAPVGIIDASTYMLLLYAAPEISGQWNLAPFPGTVQDDGSISRWFIANGMAAMIFNGIERTDEAWQFLQWYLSEEIQTEFALSLYATYHIFWLSSNRNAIENAPIEYAHRRVILDSMDWLRDVPRSPGQYMLERRISDAWNAMVFDGTPPRVAIDIRVIDINREFNRKMREFGFIDDAGNQLRPYTVRELDWVLEMIESAGQGG